MFCRLPRLTPGYIRYLQTQTVQNGRFRTMEPIMPRLAILLGAFGIGMSGYSTHQLTLHHRPSTRVLQWVGGPSAVGSLAAQSRARASSDMLQSGDHQSFPPAVPKLPEAQLPGRSETSLAYTASSVPS